MNLTKLLIFIFLIVTNPHYAQNDLPSFESFHKYSKTNLGLSFINFTGNVTEFTKAGGSLDLNIAEGRGKHFYGINISCIQNRTMSCKKI